MGWTILCEILNSSGTNTFIQRHATTKVNRIVHYAMFYCTSYYLKVKM